MALCAALYLPGQGVIPPVDRDEALYVQATEQMLASGNFLIPRVGEAVRLIKPPGVYWAQSAAVRLLPQAGSTMASHRLPSAVAAALAVLGTWRIGRIWFAPPAATLGGALLAAAALVVAEAHLATTDALLLASIVAAQGCLAGLFAGLRGRRRAPVALAAGFWIAQGLGMLLKGPVAPLVSMLTVGALMLSAPRGGYVTARRMIGALRPWWGAPLAAAWILPWVVAVGGQLGWQALPNAMAADLLPKIGGVHESHGGPPGLHLLLVPVTFWPGSLVLLFAVSYAWRHRRRPGERFLLAWLVPVWVVFECLPTKLPHYVLPAFPPLALLAGRGALAAAATICPSPRHPAVQTALWGWGAIAVTLAGGLAVAAPRLGAPASVVGWAALASAVGLAVAWCCLRWVRRLDLARAAVAAVVAAMLFYAVLLQQVLPNLDALWMARQVGALMARHDAAGLLVVGSVEASVRVLSGVQVRAVESDAAVARLATQPRDLALVSDDQLGTFVAAAQRRMVALRHVAAVEGLDYTHGRWLTLHVFAAP